MSKPRVSVVMPCYNCARTLQTSVNSVLAQSSGDFELVIVDDGSSDAGAELVSTRGDARIQLIRQDNAGVSAARNTGIAAARGNYLAFLDADDTWHPDFLQSLLPVLEERPDAVLAYCGWQNLGLPGERGAPFVPPDYETPEKLEALFTGCRWPIHAALVRRQAVVDAGGFNVALKNAEDFALWLAIASDRPILRVPRVLAYYHFDGDAQASANHLRAALHHLEAQRGFLRDFPRQSNRLGLQRARRLMYTELLHKGYERYWQRDLPTARPLFRRVLTAGQAGPKDLKYLLPALLPLSMHRWLVEAAQTKTVDDRGKGHH